MGCFGNLFIISRLCLAEQYITTFGAVECCFVLFTLPIVLLKPIT